VNDDTSMPDRSCRVIEARVEPSNIGLLVMLMEACEGLGIVRTTDPARGHVDVWTPPSQVTATRTVLEGLAADLNLLVLGERPWDAARDWAS